MRRIGEAGLTLIAVFEGFVPYLYDDVANNATVAVGHLVHIGPAHDVRGVCARCDEWPRQRERELWLTAARGYALLADEVVGYADAVDQATRPDISQNQFDALVSLCYNIGQGGYINSRVRFEVNNGGDVCGALNQIIYGTDGVAYPGLVRRRKAECALYMTPGGTVSDSGGDEMWTRFNGFSVPFEHAPKAIGAAFIGVRRDMAVPAVARAVDLDVFLQQPVPPNALVIFKDSDRKSYAGQVSVREPHAVIRCVLDGIGDVHFDVLGAPVTFERIGILGYVT